MHILVVEDDAELGVALAEFFQEQEHQVTLATNAPHALRLVAMVQPDVVLIDIALPVFDGNYLAAEIRKREQATPRLIAVTGRKGSVQVSLFDDLVLKPVSPTELLKSITPAHEDTLA